jgi:hypothetical protein
MLELKVVYEFNWAESFKATDSADKYELNSTLAVQNCWILLKAEFTNID